MNWGYDDMASIGFGAAQGLESVLEDLFRQQLEKTRAAEQQQEMAQRQQQMAMQAKQMEATERQRQIDNDYRAGNETYEREQAASERKMADARLTEMDALSAMGAVAQDPRDVAKIEQNMVNRGGRLVKPAAPAERPRQTINGRIVEKADDGQWNEVYAAPAEQKPRRTGFHNDRLIDLDTGDVIKHLPGDPKAGPATPSVSPYSLERTTRTLDTIAQLKPLITNWSAGPGASLAKIPVVGGSTDAGQLKAKLRTLAAQISFNELAQMREASKTGGALGNVSNIELELLSNSLAAIDQTQDPAVLRGELEQIEQSLTRWRDALQRETGPTLGAGVSVGAAQSGMGGNAAARALIEKYRKP